jgi:hypothetical protein
MKWDEVGEHFAATILFGVLALLALTLVVQSLIVSVMAGGWRW